MKYLSFFAFLLLLLLLITACSGEKKSNTDTTKKRDQPNYENVTKSTSTPKADEKAAARVPSSSEQLKEARGIIAAVSSEDLAAVDGKKVFKMYCAACHGFTGDLNVNGATDLIASTLPLEERVAQVYNGRGLMTPFKGLLKDKEIVAVGKYVERLRK